VTQLAPHLRNTGMVFQSFAIWPHLTVAENVAFGLRERRVDKNDIATRVREALGAVNMGQHLARRVDQLSGGEQQRVALARALVNEPVLLPTSLSPTSTPSCGVRCARRSAASTEIRSDGRLRHPRPEEALAIADRVAVMKSGRILGSAQPTEIYRWCRARWRRSLATNLVRGRSSTRWSRHSRSHGAR
jgi:iron(III) transport system ATP-binding protein